MSRINGFVLSALVALAACSTSAPQPVQLGPDGRPLPKIYMIGDADAGRVQYNMLDSINALRTSAGRPPLTLNAQLNAAAATHSRDMSRQNRPWHFGSDGSSVIDRVQRTGYAGRAIGENISETYETELETLSDWMAINPTREVILDPNARAMGFAWWQEPGGKLWWTLVTAQ